MTHVAKIAVEGKVVYLGRKGTREEARAAERDARAEHARTGRVARARSTYSRRSPDRLCVDDAYLWYDSHFSSRRAELTGPQKLMLEVLFRTIQDLTAGSLAARSAAVRWFRSDRRDHVFAFATICDEFGIPVESARVDILHGGHEPARR